MTWKVPVKTDWMTEQSNHAPSMSYAKNIYDVASTLSEGFTALEIGMAWGFSTLAILEAGAKSLTSIDPNILAKGHEEALANGYDNHEWNVVRSDVYWKENDVKFDLIYVDGSHIYDDVKNDLYEAWKRLDNGGMLLIDDWEHKKNNTAEDDRAEYGVSLACFQFWADHHDQIEGVDIEGRVLWFRKGLS